MLAGTVDGIRYQTSLKGSYTLVVAEQDREHAVGMGLCSKQRPDVTLYCNVFRENGRGELSESELEAFAAVCRGITVE
jgi:hypothetical protein